MRILITSDIHDIANWHGILSEEAKGADLLLLCGDVLDGYKECGLLEQMLRFRKWMKSLRAQGTPCVVACGNHDFNNEDFLSQEPKENNLTPDIFPEDEEEEILLLIQHLEWLNALASPLFHPPAQSQAYEEGKTILTSLKYGARKNSSTRTRNEKALVHGLELKSQSKGTWIVAHHVPPTLPDICPEKMSSPYALDIIQTYAPDILVCGHYHIGWDSIPRIGKTWILNPGHAKLSEKPNTILLDTDDLSGTHRKNGISEKFQLTSQPNQQ